MKSINYGIVHFRQRSVPSSRILYDPLISMPQIIIPTSSYAQNPPETFHLAVKTPLPASTSNLTEGTRSLDSGASIDNDHDVDGAVVNTYPITADSESNETRPGENNTSEFAVLAPVDGGFGAWTFVSRFVE